MAISIEAEITIHDYILRCLKSGFFPRVIGSLGEKTGDAMGILMEAPNGAIPFYRERSGSTSRFVAYLTNPNTIKSMEGL